MTGQVRTDMRLDCVRVERGFGPADDVGGQSLAEFGIVAAQGRRKVKDLITGLLIPTEVARDSGMMSPTIPI